MLRPDPLFFCSYSYYKNGLKKSLTMPDGTINDYTYDNNNQISIISVPGQGSMTFNKYKWNMPETITLPGGTRRDNTYDPLMQLKSITSINPSQNPLMNCNYDYSPTGNITGKNTEQGNYSYQYDNLYRLTQATNAGGANEAYTHDLLGNRLNSANVAGSWAYNENNELLSNGDISYEYDANGNVLKKTDQTGTTNFAYDLDNRLVQLITPNSQFTTYYYDPFGRRLWKDVNGARTYFFYSDEGLIGEYDGTGNEIKTYGYAPDSVWSTNPMFQKIGTRYYWYQNDHLGSPQTILDTTGRIVWSATYDAFGNIHITNAEIENNLRFPGQYYDGETGLHYNYFRYYDPSTGRYITKDPIGFAGGDVNLYRYVGNNPISIRDPGGLRFLPYHFLETLIAGFLTGHFVKSFVWAYESMAEDWAPGAHSSNLAQNTNIHGLRGRDPVTLQLQTPAEAERWIYQSIIKSASCGKHGQAAHTIQDARAWGHKGQSWEGNNDPVENPSVLRHWLWDISPFETPGNFMATYRYLITNAEPSGTAVFFIDMFRYMIPRFRY